MLVPKGERRVFLVYQLVNMHILLAYILLLVHVEALNLHMSAKGKALILDRSVAPLRRQNMGLDIANALHASNPDLEIVVLRDICCKSGEASQNMPPSVSVQESKTSLADGGLKQYSGEAAYVIDNWSSSLEDASMVIELSKNCKAGQVVHLSCATDLYKAADISPLGENENIDEERESRKIELAFAAGEVPTTVVRCQYVHGGEQSPVLEYLVARLTRSMHIPLPLHGEQLLSLTHVNDLGGLISLCLGQSAAMKQTFNCAGDTFITYKGLCERVNSALGGAEDIKYLYFEPKLFDVDTGGDPYPLGRSSSLLSSARAKSILGWSPSHDVNDDLDIEILRIASKEESTDGPTLKHFMHDLEIIASKDIEFTFDYDFIN